MKVLCVCLGNICRSPLAEGILKSKADRLGLGWQIDSAGTGAWHIGELPDKRSIAVARDNGIDITDQRARKVTAQDLEYYDLILAMDESNEQDLKSMTHKRNWAKIHRLTSFLPHGSPVNVPDPYYGGDQGFEKVYELIDQATEALIHQKAEIEL